MLSKAAIKYIQSLSFKKFRDENALFIAEGPKIVEEIIAAGTYKIKAVYGVESYISTIEHTLEQATITYMIVSEDELKKISTLVNPNRVVAIVYQRPFEEIINVSDNITLVLDDISDPGNLGTIIRIADWFGIEHIICSNNCVDKYNSKVVQSSMASIIRVNIIYTELQDFLNKHSDVPSYAATIDGSNVFKVEKPQKCFLIIGNEANGISGSLLKNVSKKITIPRIGNAESLNAAVATGILVAALKN